MIAIIISGSILIGYLIAEIIHRKSKKKLKKAQLVDEYISSDYYQFITLEEWLSKNL